MDARLHALPATVTVGFGVARILDADERVV
jgi:hypothetical protein